MLPVIEMFASIQGEGKLAGVPSIFIRTSGCNLRCCFKGSICDTPYSSYNPEKALYKSEADLVQAFKDLAEANPNINHIVITGGEPLLHAEALSNFLTEINYHGDYHITVETNGTMMPITYKVKDEPFQWIDLYSISPKLSTSVAKEPNAHLTQADIDRHERFRINIESLRALMDTSYEYQLKFVYSGPEAEQEIDELISRIREDKKDNIIDIIDAPHDSANDYVMLMPEGITNEQLGRTRKEAAEICVRRGWQFTDRLHIIIWGDKRGF